MMQSALGRPFADSLDERGNVIGFLEREIRDSIAAAYANPEIGWEFIREHSQCKTDDVIRSHIQLYVNEFSEDIGDVGRRAIAELERRAIAAGLI